MSYVQNLKIEFTPIARGYYIQDSLQKQDELEEPCLSDGAAGRLCGDHMASYAGQGFTDLNGALHLQIEILWEFGLRLCDRERAMPQLHSLRLLRTQTGQ